MEKLSATKFKMLNSGEKHNNHLSQGGIVYAQAAIRQKLPIPMKPFRLSSFMLDVARMGHAVSKKKLLAEVKSKRKQKRFNQYLLVF